MNDTIKQTFTAAPGINIRGLMAFSFAQGVVATLPPALMSAGEKNTLQNLFTDVITKLKNCTHEDEAAIGLAYHAHRLIASWFSDFQHMVDSHGRNASPNEKQINAALNLAKRDLFLWATEANEGAYFSHSSSESACAIERKFRADYGNNF